MKKRVYLFSFYTLAAERGHEVEFVQSVMIEIVWGKPFNRKLRILVLFIALLLFQLSLKSALSSLSLT